MSLSSRITFPRFALGVLVYNLAVIAWGAFVRATGSGAGCADHWPLCKGAVVPPSPGTATLIEFTHRATSGIALLAVVALFVWAMRRYPSGHLARRAAGASLAFMVIEAGIGAALVLLALVGENSSAARAVVMALHLVNTFFLLGALAMTHRASLERRGRPWRADPAVLIPWALGTFGLMALGASGAIAALGDTLFPATSLGQGLADDLSPAAHFLVRIRMLHPLLAMLLGVYILLLAHVLRRYANEGTVTRSATILLLLYLTQIAAGIVNLVLLAPIWMQLVHLLLADLTWIAWIHLGCDAGDALPNTRWRTAPATHPPLPQRD